MRDPVSDILRYNRKFRGRYPRLLRHKVDLMCRTPFLFFRGTFHLFAADWIEGRFDAWPRTSPLRERSVRICADVHGQNFGTTGVEHHHARFGVNDFDDTSTGPLDFDACRGAASLILTGGRPGVDAARAFVEAYVAALGGKRLPDAAPIVRLLRMAEEARRSPFIDKRTQFHKGHRKFRGTPYFPLRPEHREQALRLLADYLRRFHRSSRRKDGFFDAEDAAGRIAGCASLGRLRYVVLLRGEGSREARNVILELKESLPSALDASRGRVPRGCRAEQVVDAARAFQGESDPFLGFAVDGASSFQVRQLSPRNLPVEKAPITKADDFREIAATNGAHLALAHRRANPGVAARLLREAVGKVPEAFIRRTMSFALAYAQQAEDDWRLFAASRRRVAAELTAGGKR